MYGKQEKYDEKRRMTEQEDYLHLGCKVGLPPHVSKVSNVLKRTALLATAGDNDGLKDTADMGKFSGRSYNVLSERRVERAGEVAKTRQEDATPTMGQHGQDDGLQEMGGKIDDEQFEDWCTRVLCIFAYLIVAVPNDKEEKQGCKL